MMVLSLITGELLVYLVYCRKKCLPAGLFSYSRTCGARKLVGRMRRIAWFLVFRSCGKRSIDLRKRNSEEIVYTPLFFFLEVFVQVNGRSTNEKEKERFPTALAEPTARDEMNSLVVDCIRVLLLVMVLPLKANASFCFDSVHLEGGNTWRPLDRFWCVFESNVLYVFF